MVKDKMEEIKYREVIEYDNGYRIINKYPIITKEENKRRKEEILTKLYHEFTKDCDA
ncbi:MAG: hypothetical protein M0P99_07015 [Candidatus Cloacimonetes bacterium]|jgi:hypothetical protein|nr:hypothetical protein [Candidatus Cloacimonadota bacterium]